jgi:hypothetical protein
MTRWVVTVLTIALCSVSLYADVTVTSTVSVQGTGGPVALGNMQPRMVMRIKGSKARADIDLNGQTMSSITDVAGKQIILLRADQKTAQVMTPANAGAAAGMPPMRLPKVDATSKRTGQSRTIDGVPCEEYAISMKVNMAEMSGSPQMPPEAAAMLKDVRMIMTGSMWVAKSGPGVAEYASFQKAAAAANLAGFVGGAIPGLGASGLDRMMTAVSGTEGIPYLTEMNMTVEGSGQMVEMMKQLGNMKMTNKVTAVSTDPIADDLFAVPADYKVIK